MDPQPGILLPLFVSSILLISATPTAAGDAYPSVYGGEESCGLAGGDVVVPRGETYGNGRILDITHRYRSDMPAFESDQGIGEFVRLLTSTKNGSIANVSEMKVPTHTGTHVDAPGHFYDHYFDSGFDVDSLDLHVLNQLIDALFFLFYLSVSGLQLHSVQKPVAKRLTAISVEYC